MQFENLEKSRKTLNSLLSLYALPPLRLQLIFSLNNHDIQRYSGVREEEIERMMAGPDYHMYGKGLLGGVLALIRWVGGFGRCCGLDRVIRVFA